MWASTVKKTVKKAMVKTKVFFSVGREVNNLQVFVERLGGGLRDGQDHILEEVQELRERFETTEETRARAMLAMAGDIGDLLSGLGVKHTATIAESRNALIDEAKMTRSDLSVGFTQMETTAKQRHDEAMQRLNTATEERAKTHAALEQGFASATQRDKDNQQRRAEEREEDKKEREEDKKERKVRREAMLGAVGEGSRKVLNAINARRRESREREVTAAKEQGAAALEEERRRAAAALEEERRRADAALEEERRRADAAQCRADVIAAKLEDERAARAKEGKEAKAQTAKLKEESSARAKVAAATAARLEEEKAKHRRAQFAVAALMGEMDKGKGVGEEEKDGGRKME